jgi:integral membrane protein (TIGR00529 family)
MTILKLVLVLALIVFGIKRKYFVGYLLFGAGILTPLLFGFGPTDIVMGVWGTLKSVDFWRLYAAITVVTILGHFLKKIGSLERLTDSAQELAGGKRTATAILPAAVGLMPMPGGALLSAPLVGEVLKNDGKSPQYMSAVNYWFRHVMEFFWPLYPGIILGAVITGIKVQTFSFLGVIMSLAMIIIGYVFFLSRIKNNNQATRSFRALGRISLAIWPLFLAVFLAMALRIDIVLALVVSITVTVISNRDKWALLWPVIRESVTIRLFFMIFGIIVFKDLLELSGAVGDIPGEVARFGIPPAAVILVVAFLSGLLSGMVAAFVGLSFPILAGFLYIPEINLGNIFLAYLSGYLGMILSPAHFCLILTAEHFNADLGRVYHKFLVPLLILAIVGFLLYLSGYPWNMIGI